MVKAWSKIDEIAQELAIVAGVQFRAVEALKAWEILKKYYLAGPPKFNDFARENARTIEDKLTSFLNSLIEPMEEAPPNQREEGLLNNDQHYRRLRDQNRQTQLLLIEKMLSNKGILTVGLLSPMALYLGRMETDGVVKEVARDGKQITYQLIENM